MADERLVSIKKPGGAIPRKGQILGKGQHNWVVGAIYLDFDLFIGLFIAGQKYVI